MSVLCLQLIAQGFTLTLLHSELFNVTLNAGSFSFNGTEVISQDYFTGILHSIYHYNRIYYKFNGIMSVYQCCTHQQLTI